MAKWKELVELELAKFEYAGRDVKRGLKRHILMQELNGNSKKFDKNYIEDLNSKYYSKILNPSSSISI